MADVSLDDLIKKDKNQGKVSRLKQVRVGNIQKLKSKKFASRGKPSDNQNRGDKKPRDPVHDKHRPIRKRFEDKRDRRDKRGPKDFPERRAEKPKPKAPVEKKEEGEKQFRTLKVMGLSPEFTNDDLYVGLS